MVPESSFILKYPRVNFLFEAFGYENLKIQLQAI